MIQLKRKGVMIENPLIRPDERIKLEAYLNELWVNSHDFITGTFRQSKSTKQKLIKFEQSGKVYKLKPGKYIGFVEQDELQISIWPRVFDGYGWPTNKMFEQLNVWLEIAEMTSFKLSTNDAKEDEPDSLFEFFVRYFASLARELAYHEPYSQYQRMTEELPTIKGSLNIGQYINNNIVTGKWQHFTCDYAPFEYDNLFNRIIKYVCRLLINRTKVTGSINDLDAVLSLYHEVTDQHITAQDCDRVRLNAMFIRHQQLLDLAKIFLNDLHILPNESGEPTISFFLDMNKLFEAVVGKGMKKANKELTITTQAASQYLATANGEPYFQLKPDILIQKTCILDTKYKFRTARDHDGNPNDISQADMYQMVTYALKYGCNNVLLIYPKPHNYDPKIDEVAYKVEIAGQTIIVRTTSVDLMGDSSAALIERFKFDKDTCKFLPIASHV